MKAKFGMKIERKLWFAILIIVGFSELKFFGLLIMRDGSWFWH